jgi:hypothetical protein
MHNVIIKIKVDDKGIFTKIRSTEICKIDKLKSTFTLMISNPEDDYL